MTRLANRFELDREIGAGGMSRVFLGRDEILDRPVAVKILRKQYGGTDIGARFQREGRTAARLSHPVVVRVYDAGESEFEGHEVSYIVMEYVPGGDLKDLIREHESLPGPRLAAIGERVAAALAYAHERGIVHRDIKPHNILLDERGAPRLTDFGIARALDATQATRTGAYLGTAVYSPPEQLKGEKVTPKSDVYSLGVTLYEAAIGELPFTGSTLEIANQHVGSEPVPPTQRGADLNEDLEALILSCLAKDPDARPTAEALREKLATLKKPPQEISETRAAPPPPPPPTTGENSSDPGSPGGRSGRSRGVLALLALLAVLAVVAALAIPAFSGGNENASSGGDKKPNNGQNSSRNAKNNPNSNANGNVDRAEGGGQTNENQISATSEKTPEPTAPPEKTQENKTSKTPDGLTAAAAEQTVREFYSSAASKDYGTFDSLLSNNLRQTFPDEGTFDGTFKTLKSIEFIEGPSAQVSQGTATVTGTTRAEHTDRTEQNTGTWTLVDDNGEWKLDNISVQTRQI